MVKTRVLVCAVSALLILSSNGAFASAVIASSPTTACDALDSLDLATHAGNQINSRLSQSDPAKGLPLFSNRDFSLTSNPWTANADSWTKKGTLLDFTGVAGYLFTTYNTANRIGTLISPRHFIAAAHYHPAKDEVLGFIDKDGNRIERTVVGGQSIGSTDIYVGVLDSDLPDSIAYYPLMASSTLKSLVQKFDTNALDVPIVTLDQEAKALVHKLSSISDTYISHAVYAEGNYKDWGENMISGDSGQPGFVIIDNQPVLLFAHHLAAAGPNYGNYIKEINSAMTSLGGGYQATEYDPICFTKYAVNHIPSFQKYPQKIILHTDTALRSALGVYNATDADSEQTLSYSLASLIVDASTALNPSDYFSIDPASGELSLIAPLDPDIVGKEIKLAVKVEDSGQNIGSATATTTVDFRSALNQTKKIILDPDFKRPDASPASFTGISFDSEGKLVAIGGFTAVNGVAQKGIARLNSNGDIDPSFQAEISGRSRSMFVDNDGKIVMGGFAGRIDRLNDDGSADDSFGTAAGYGFSGGIANKVIDVNGEILVTGIALQKYNGANIRGVAMIKHDGALDADFHANFGGITGGSGNTLFFDGENIYIGGNFSVYTLPDSSTVPAGRLIKVSKDGQLDSVFAANMGTGFDNQVRDIVARPDGKIVVVGDFHKFNGADISSIALLNPDGTLDSAFVASVAKIDNNLFAVIADKDNKMIIGGNVFKIGESTFKSGIARLNADGTSDEEFNNALGDGIDGGVTELLWREDGAVVAIGNLNSYDGTALNNSIAILMPLEETKESEQTSTTTSASNSSSTSSGGGGGGGGGGGSAPAQSPSVPAGTLSGASFVTTQSPGVPSAYIQEQSPAFSPKRNLHAGVSGEDVRGLQKYLNTKGFPVSLSGVGSSGNETAYFGGKTKAALAKFQKSAGVSPSVGFLGPLTRAYILSH